MKEIAKAAKFIAVAGTIGFAFVGDFGRSPVCHNNRDLVVMVKTRTVFGLLVKILFHCGFRSFQIW